MTVERVGLDQHRTLTRCELPRCWDWAEYRYELPSGATDLLCRGHFAALLGDMVVDALQTTRHGTLGNVAKGSMTPDDRFQVCDPVCGLIGTERTRDKALTEARHHDQSNTCPPAVVYDVMARRGRPQEWTADGEVKAFRPSSASPDRPNPH